MSQLTVFFDPPYWVGVFEERDGQVLQTCRIVFGPEPKDYEIYAFVLQQYYQLKFSRPIAIEESVSEQRLNPKRMQREIQKQLSQTGVSTKAQEAMRLERDAQKRERQVKSKLERDKEEQLRFKLKQEKKKQKKRGH